MIITLSSFSILKTFSRFSQDLLRTIKSLKCLREGVEVLPRLKGLAADPMVVDIADGESIADGENIAACFGCVAWGDVIIISRCDIIV